MNVTNAQTSHATRVRPQAGAGTQSVGTVLARVPYFQSLSPAEVRALDVRAGAVRAAGHRHYEGFSLRGSVGQS